MNSDRTFAVNVVSRLKTVVRLVKSGMPIVLMEAGSVDVRPASVYHNQRQTLHHRGHRGRRGRF